MRKNAQLRIMSAANALNFHIYVLSIARQNKLQ